MFTKQEMETRMSILRRKMSELGVEATVFTSYHNINYYSQFIYCYFGRPYGLVITQDDATIVSAGNCTVLPLSLIATLSDKTTLDRIVGWTKFIFERFRHFCPTLYCPIRYVLIFVCIKFSKELWLTFTTIILW